MPWPTTVTLVDPVVAALTPSTLLSATALLCVNIHVEVPAPMLSRLITRLCHERLPCEATLPAMLLSDVHTDAVAAVPAAREQLHASTAPLRPIPTTVTLVDPVEAALDAVTELTTTDPVLKAASVVWESLRAMVAASPKLGGVVDGSRAVTTVSDDHIVVSAVVDPTETVPDESALKNALPTTVTLVDPVEAALDAFAISAIGLSVLKAFNAVA